jgi:hypothetical protein
VVLDSEKTVSGVMWTPRHQSEVRRVWRWAVGLF